MALPFMRVKSGLRWSFPTVFVGVAGLLLSLLLFLMVREWETTRIMAGLELIAKDDVKAFQRQIDRGLEVLLSVGAFLTSSDEMDREKFKEFVGYAISRHPEMQAVGWVPRVLEWERARFEKRAQQAGFVNYRISEGFPPEGGARGAAREEYFPLLYVEPFHGHEALLGFDYALDPAAMEVMKKARDWGAFFATPWEKLGSEEAVEDVSSLGFRVYLPVYRGGKARQTLESRRENLTGFALGIFRIDEMAQMFLKHLGEKGIDVYLFSPSSFQNDGKHYFYRSRDGKVEPFSLKDVKDRTPSDLYWSSNIIVAGQVWSIFCQPTESFFSSHRRLDPWMVLAFGLLLTGILTSYFYVGQNRAFRIRRLVEERTQELTKANRDLEGAYLDLERSEQKFRTLVSNIPGVIYRCARDPGWTMYFLSEAIKGISGYPASDFLHNKVRSYGSIIHPEDRGIVEKIIYEAVDKKIPYILEYRILHADGGIRWVYEKGQGVFGEGGKLLWLDGAIFDVTERKKSQEVLLQKTVELARSNAQREQLELFAYAASHDLQAPLQKIISMSDFLKAHNARVLDNEAQSYLDRMQNVALRMSQMIDSLFRFTKVTRKAEPVELVSLREVIQEVLSDLEPRVADSHASVDVQGLPAVKADRLQMYELFQNLITNALKFHEKDKPPHVVIDSHPMGEGFVEVDVSDEGIGFDERYLDRIFKPFERLHNLAEFEGDGMGLTICKKIVQNYGGDITARSMPGKGSTFMITLPATNP